MSWGDYAHLASSIELAQAATVKIGGGTAVMISERYALTAAHVVIDEGENVLTSNLIATNLWGETRTIINAYFDTAADFAVIELETPFQNSYSIKIANTAAQQDDEIFTVGHPWTTKAGGIGWAVAFGSAYSLYKEEDTAQYFDVDVEGGFSGGGIYNSAGDLVSIVSGHNTAHVQSPYYVENKPVHNKIWDFDNNWNTLGVQLPFIHAFLMQYAVANIPKINPTLPDNLPDPVKISFVSDETLAIIQQISKESLNATVAIFGGNITDISNINSPNASGVLISADLVLTVMHVLDGRQTVTVSFKNGEVIDNAKSLAVSPYADFGLIKLPVSAPTSYIPVSIAFAAVQNNKPVYTVGHPNKLWYSSGGWQVSAGMTQGTGEGLLEFSGITGGGNSGGGIFNIEGHVIGVLAQSGISYRNWTNDRQDPHGTSYNPSIQPNSVGSYSSDFGYLKNLVLGYSPDSLTTLPSITNNYVSDMLIQTSSKYLLTGWEHSSAGNQIYVKSISSDGKPNLAFADNGVFRTTLEGNNNRGIAAASVKTDQLFIGINTGNDSHTNFGIICLKNDGTLDKNFGTDGIVITQTDNIDQLQKIEIQYNGKILLAGTRFNGETVDILVVRYNKDGSIDESFGNNGTVTIDIEAGSSDFLTDIALDSNSNILVSGYTDASGKFDVFISRFNAAGNLDSSFGAQGIALINFGGNDTATDMVIQDDGKIVVVGRGDNGMRQPTLIVARTLDSGILDDSFSEDGKALFPFSNQNSQHHIKKVLSKGDGGILVLATGYQGSLSPEASRNLDISVVAIKADGEIDPSYGINGQVYFDSTTNDYAVDIEELDSRYYVIALSDNKGETFPSIVELSSNLVLKHDNANAFLNSITMTNYVSGQYTGTNSEPMIGTTGPDIVHTYWEKTPNISTLAGNDIVIRNFDGYFAPVIEGSTIINGGAGIDTAIYKGSLSNFRLTNDADNWVIITQGVSDNLVNIERLQFADANLALDLDGHAGQTVKLLGLLLGKDQATNKTYVGTGLKLLDDGMTYEQLMSAALDVVLGANASALSVVELIWNNLIGPPTPADNIGQYAALIDNGTYTSAGLAVIAADHSLNTTAIDLVGLSQTGVEYIPYG